MIIIHYSDRRAKMKIGVFLFSLILVSSVYADEIENQKDDGVIKSAQQNKQQEEGGKKVKKEESTDPKMCENDRVETADIQRMYYFHKFHVQILSNLRIRIERGEAHAGEYVTLKLSQATTKRLLESECDYYEKIEYHQILGSRLTEVRYIQDQIQLLDQMIQKERDLLLAQQGNRYILLELRSTKHRLKIDLQNKKQNIITILDSTDFRVEWESVKDVFTRDEYPFKNT